MDKKGQVKITTAKPIVGKKVFYFIQSIHAEKGEGALLPAYRTDGSTKLGGLLEKSSDEHSIDLTQYFAPMDPSINVVLDAQAKGESIKIWRVIVDDSVKTQIGEDPNKKDAYPAKFGYAKITDDVEFNDGVEEFVELSYTAGIVGRLQDGKFPLSAEELAVLNNIYAYQNPGETTGDYDNIQR